MAFHGEGFSDPYREGFEGLTTHKRFTAKSSVNRLFFEATMGIEPMVRVLQTLALPLGDVAARQIIRDSICFVNQDPA